MAKNPSPSANVNASAVPNANANTFRSELEEAPTAKRTIPPELLDPNPATYVTTRPPKADIDRLLTRERDKSGMRAAVTQEAIDRFQQNEHLDTVPAPPSVPEPDEDPALANDEGEHGH